MANLTSNSYFANSYTFNIAGNSKSLDITTQNLIQTNALAVIDYLSNYISWKGTLDFVLYVRDPAGTGLLPAYGGVGGNGLTYGLSEAISGTDANGNDFDVGAYLIPNQSGGITNYGSPVYFDPNPNPYSLANIPSGSHDFFSIYLHETLHSFGFWSTAQHAGFGQSAFDKLTVLRASQYFFNGPNTVALLGAELPLATSGSRDHYSTNKIGGVSPIDRGSVFEYGNYEQNRWTLGQIDLAVLKDLGWKIGNEALLPLTEQKDSATAYFGRSITGANLTGVSFTGTTDSDSILGTLGSDSISGVGGSDYIDARAGFDKILFSGMRSEYQVQAFNSSFIVTDKMQARDGVDTVDNTERLVFKDAIIATDINGNAGQAYRLYQAALDRTPDERGLAGWIKFMDEGGALVNMAQQFIDSQEFRTKYGALDDRNFVNQLYLNVLDRNGEPAGIAGWVGGLANGLTRADVLKGFSESSENQANVIGQIKNGIPYVEWWLP